MEYGAVCEGIVVQPCVAQAGRYESVNHGPRNLEIP